MKKILIYTMILAATVLTASCNKDELDTKSHILDSVNEQTDFDKWLEENFRAPYNIRFLYRYEDIQTDMSYNIAPADELYCRILAKMLRYLWIDVYSECGGHDFMRRHSPRMLQIVGSGAFNSNNTINIGFAEGGQKITLNVANWMEKEGWVKINYKDSETKDWTKGYSVEILKRGAINGYYLHFTHHEYAHILHQTISYPTEFKTISQGDYAAQWNSLTTEAAAKLGFVSNYASGNPDEDFVEVFSIYVTSSDDEWQTILNRAGSTGAAIIKKKLDIVKSYMQVSWNIDVEQMRAAMERRYDDIAKLDWDNFNTEE